MFPIDNEKINFQMHNISNGSLNDITVDFPLGQIKNLTTVNVTMDSILPSTEIKFYTNLSGIEFYMAEEATVEFYVMLKFIFSYFTYII